MAGVAVTENVALDGSRSTHSFKNSLSHINFLLLRDPFILLMFLSLLTLGSDTLSIGLGGMTLKIVFPILITAFVALGVRQQGNISFDRRLAVLFLLWALAGFASAFQSYQPGKSLGYITWLLFNFFVIIGLGYNLARGYGPRLAFALWFLVFRVHAILIFLELAFNAVRGTFSRPALWFYEPSYLAIFMIAYFGSSLCMLLREGRAYRIDFLLATASMLVITSATGILGVLLAVLLNLLVARQRIKLLLWASGITAVFFGLLIVFFQGTPYYVLLVGFLFNRGDVLQLILDRGGNRVVRAIIGWHAFQQHPLLGVGIGADSAYMEQSPIPDQAMPYVHSWINVAEGQPFSNIFIEVLGTTGLAGFGPFVGILILAVARLVRQIRDKSNPEAVAFLMGFFSVLAALQFESTVLRYYLWAPLGLALGSMVYNKVAAPQLQRTGP